MTRHWRHSELFDLVAVDSDNAYRFAGLTVSNGFDGLVRGKPARPEVIAVGATVLLSAVGLIVAAPGTPSAAGNYAVDSLVVSPRFRNQGVGTALLRALVKRLKEAGLANRLTVRYLRPDDVPTCPMDTLLARCGFSEPVKTGLVARSDYEHYCRAPWYHRFEFSPGCGFVLWSDLTGQQKADLRQVLEAERCCPPELTPPADETELDPTCSVALCRNGSVQGWMLLRRQSEKSVSFWRMFVMPELQHYGKYALELVSQAVDRAHETGYRQASFSVDAHNARMCRLVYRRMRPYLKSVQERYASTTEVCRP